MTRVQRLIIVLALNLALVAALLLVGITARSLAVFAEGGDYLLDAAGVSVTLLAVRISARQSNTVQRPGGANATTLAVLINAGWLLVLEVLIAGAAVDRLVGHTPRVAGLPVLVVSAVAALAMAIGALVLRSEGESTECGERDLSLAAVLLDTIADASAAAGVATAGAIILGTDGWYWLDPAVALVVAVVFGYHAFRLSKEAVGRLRRTSAPVTSGR